MSELHAGSRIRELRENNHYSREVLAEKVEISAKFLYEIETGRKGFSADVLGRLSKVLGVSCDYIMFGEEVRETRKYDDERLECVLEIMESNKTEKVQDIVKVLYEICNVL